MQFFQTQDLDKIEKDLKSENGLNNKSALYFLINHILTQHQRYEENYSLIMFECKVGENVDSKCSELNQKRLDGLVADKLRSICRKSDVLFHCSDGFFCILTRVFEGDDTIMFCKKIDKNLSSLNYDDDCKINLDLKFGITFSKDKDTVESFSQRAFEALKKAKGVSEKVIVKV
ncbi:GGDEF domain-containing protein [Hippea sp. KM1]|uniref:GGDEF domain-containing protein n=1 Tax=Hippea sp. KM1 TaxID=944481 RepID=UPI00046D191D|nr:diguanylate cyclase [Hippea sp. KM1]